MQSFKSQYALGFRQIEDALVEIGSSRTILLEGHMGIGKSSMLPALGKRLPNHLLCYFDCTTKDLGDIMIPNVQMIDGEGKFIRYLTNEELGAHNDKPIILMLDEIGKCNRAVQSALRRVMLERKIGTYDIEGVVFATTNLGAENVGDLMEAHKRNAITTIQVRKPTWEEWIVDFGVPNKLHPSVLGFVREFPQVFQSFEEVKDPAENPYIFHPREEREAFCTPRSLHAASDILMKQDALDSDTIFSLLIGTIGARAAADLNTFVQLADQLPSLEDIKTNPNGAKVPDNAPAVCMVVFKVLGAMSRDFIDPWMTYLDRLDTEAQAMFAQSACSKDYPEHHLVMTNKKFTQWCIENNYLRTADQN